MLRIAYLKFDSKNSRRNKKFSEWLKKVTIMTLEKKIAISMTFVWQVQQHNVREQAVEVIAKGNFDRSESRERERQIFRSATIKLTLWPRIRHLDWVITRNCRAKYLEISASMSIENENVDEGNGETEEVSR